jgi:hypothetical protein
MSGGRAAMSRASAIVAAVARSVFAAPEEQVDGKAGYEFDQGGVRLICRVDIPACLIRAGPLP